MVVLLSVDSLLFGANWRSVRLMGMLRPICTNGREISSYLRRVITRLCRMCIVMFVRWARWGRVVCRLMSRRCTRRRLIRWRWRVRMDIGTLCAFVKVVSMLRSVGRWRVVRMTGCSWKLGELVTRVGVLLELACRWVSRRRPT